MVGHLYIIPLLLLKKIIIKEGYFGVKFKWLHSWKSEKAWQPVFSNLTGQLHLFQTRISWPFTMRCLNTTPLLLSPIIDPYDHYILFFDLSITYTYLDCLVVGPNWPWFDMRELKLVINQCNWYITICKQINNWISVAH